MHIDNTWKTSGVVVFADASKEATDAAELAASLSLPSKSAGQPWFRISAALHPSGAAKLREHAIRMFKPHLRRSTS
ncbi:MAG: hypothetical protein K2P58_13205 [Hyphomonadaceae bacterium]|nr:hypothetical protein [Hyphomonadaceae bacterium]